jgi:hypothetical protein
VRPLAAAQQEKPTQTGGIVPCLQERPATEGCSLHISEPFQALLGLLPGQQEQQRPANVLCSHNILLNVNYPSGKGHPACRGIHLTHQRWVDSSPCATSALPSTAMVA